MMRLIFTEGALADFESILNYIAKDNQSAAVRFGEGLIETCELLEKIPELGVKKKRSQARLTTLHLSRLWSLLPY
ncbi:type II toxin-antitoxin system RelE/ParE family toxin [Bythopirellula goksoeyrii]|uniref:Plasmid stabilization system protein n=1 Tax=Bythopirellula goksoeyrii TaxID=1400387 RepID=A0A5B9Q8R6_9BACT|nr:type II toxin-antitoxin system RelE/ParE family toxin [Bythopirellula goksoeyrii]QEG34070.1 Plasmid stabilization system protein [Bythopirellula goksoeyrii]